MKLRSIFLLTVVLFLFLAVSGCVTSVSSLKANPERYLGKKVIVTGEVGRVIGIPFTEYSVYMLQDRNGRIPVFTVKDKEKGAKVAVNAEVVGYSGTRTAEESREAQKTVSDFLVEHDFAKRDTADDIANGIFEVVRRLSDAAEGAYFLLER